MTIAMTMACRSKLRPIEEEMCLLCDTRPVKSRRALVTHIGKHMEEVALMALPRTDGSESGDESNSHDDLDSASTWEGLNDDNEPDPSVAVSKNQCL